MPGAFGPSMPISGQDSRYEADRGRTVAGQEELELVPTIAEKVKATSEPCRFILSGV